MASNSDSMLDELIKKEENFQVKLKPNEYTFIGPKDPNSLPTFYNLVNEIAPTSFFSTMHDSLKNKESVRKALTLLGNIPLQIYIIREPKSGDDSIMAIRTIDE